MANWFSSLMQGSAERSAAKDVSRFVDGLRRTSDRDIGVIVGIAAVVRVNMETHGVLPAGLFGRQALAPGRELGVLQMRLNRVARDFVKGRQAADASGVLVWSYSLRCLNLPGLIPLGRAMWAELARGFPHVEDALDEGEERNGRPFDDRVWKEWRLIPPGLDPAA
ncbi:MAG: hypothetical protein RBS99_02155 [Rhodospirillales bacterium]|jgi:hypothetical protein|nr:hypothetical protein [Rhodospirillales bacterium]